MASLPGALTAAPIGTSDRHTTPQFPVGYRFRGATGAWVYVKAGATIAQYDAVRFQGSATGYDDVRPVSATLQAIVGVADAAFASAEYGFVQYEGLCTCKVVNATAAGSALATTATAGTLGLAAATDLAGIRPAVALVTGVAAGSAIVLG